MPYFISLGLLFAKEPVGLGGCFFAAEHLLGVHRLQDVLEALAGVTASVLGAALTADPEVLSNMDLSRVQPLDRYRRHFLFDMGSVVGELKTRGLVPASLAEVWRAQLARTVTYEAHTPTMLGLALDACCGLSMYVPVSAYADLNEYYRTLEWYARCYPADYSAINEVMNMRHYKMSFNPR